MLWLQIPWRRMPWHVEHQTITKSKQDERDQRLEQIVFLLDRGVDLTWCVGQIARTLA
jgi:hypothetical protein